MSDSHTPSPQPLTIATARLTVKTAERLVAAAAAKADELKLPMALTVCDPAGVLIAFRRMDSAPLMSIQISQDKAYTAASFGLPTHQWHEFIKDDPPLANGIVHTPRFVSFGGGYPVIVDGVLSGAIGVSGGHYPEDMQCAEAALRELGLS